MINFAIRETGLEKQLLDEIFKLEEPKLEEEKVKIKNIEEDKSKQITTENEILTMLSKSEANLLEDDVLIEKLRKSKTNSDKVQDRLEKTEATMKKIEERKGSVSQERQIGSSHLIHSLGSPSDQQHVAVLTRGLERNIRVEHANENGKLYM